MGDTTVVVGLKERGGDLAMRVVESRAKVPLEVTIDGRTPRRWKSG